MTDHTYEVNQQTRDMTPQVAMKRLKLILDQPAYLCDDKGYVICSNDEHDDAQQFIRDNLDLQGMGICSDWGYEHLTPAFAQRILDDLRIIWDYEFYRDDISHIAMQLSLCPYHFCDWAACFDDDDVACAAIRTIFPHCHDT
jgi:hypothetical protein